MRTAARVMIFVLASCRSPAATLNDASAIDAVGVAIDASFDAPVDVYDPARVEVIAYAGGVADPSAIAIVRDPAGTTDRLRT